MQIRAIYFKMNLELLRQNHPYEDMFPDRLDASLDYGKAVTCAFNKQGTLLASGCNDGRIVVWDLDTKNPYTIIKCGHSRSVTSLSWSRNGRYLLSSGADHVVVLHDFAKENVGFDSQKKFTFDTHVLMALIHPRENHLCIVCPLMRPPLLIDLESEKRTPLPLAKSSDSSLSDDTIKKRVATCAAFSPCGTQIYLANECGDIVVVDVATLSVVKCLPIVPGGNVISIYVHAKGKYILANCSDKVLRLIDGESHEPLLSFFDHVNKTDWKAAAVSACGDYIVAGTAKGLAQKFYCWKSDTGNLHSILEGSVEDVMDIDWHPTNPTLAACSATGMVYIYSKKFVEKWSAYLPGFEELERNTEYEEKEDEFDLPDNTKKIAARADEDMTEVDVVTIDDPANDPHVDEYRFPVRITPDVPETISIPLPKVKSFSPGMKKKSITVTWNAMPNNSDGEPSSVKRPLPDQPKFPLKRVKIEKSEEGMKASNGDADVDVEAIEDSSPATVVNRQIAENYTGRKDLRRELLQKNVEAKEDEIKQEDWERKAMFSNDKRSKLRREFEKEIQAKNEDRMQRAERNRMAEEDALSGKMKQLQPPRSSKKVENPKVTEGHDQTVKVEAEIKKTDLSDVTEEHDTLKVETEIKKTDLSDVTEEHDTLMVETEIKETELTEEHDTLMVETGIEKTELTEEHDTGMVETSKSEVNEKQKLSEDA